MELSAEIKIYIGMGVAVVFGLGMISTLIVANWRNRNNRNLDKE